MDKDERNALNEQIKQNYRVLAKQICARAMASWARDYYRLMHTAPLDSARSLPHSEYLKLKHERSFLESKLQDVEEFFRSAWYKDVLVGMVPELTFCPFEDYKKFIIEELRDGREISFNTEE